MSVNIDNTNYYWIITFMRVFHYLLATCIALLLCMSCNKNEGLGGTSSIEGYVYSIVHRADVLTVDTIPAAGEKVYIVYSDNEDDPVADKHVETNQNGMYQFQFLRKGNYIVYALSTYPEELNKEKVAEMQHVSVGSGTASVDPIYIHSGKGYGLSMIRGKVMVQYYKNGLPFGGAPVPAVGERVFLKRLGENVSIDDTRVSDEGFFIFYQVPPGKYEVYATTETVGAKNFTHPTEPQTIEVVNANEIYDLPEIFNIILNL